MKIVIDCTPMVDEASVHTTFAQALDFPATYGRTLDSLYDMLTSTGELELTLEDAAKDNELFTLEYQD